MSRTRLRVGRRGDEDGHPLCATESEPHMDSAASEAVNPIEQIQRAFQADDAEQVRTLLERYPEIKSKINEAIGPFGSPAIVCARSRQMVDVLLAAGADLN